MWDPESYTTAALLLPRLLGFIYFCAIGAFLFQIRGLLGRQGILPVQDFLHQLKARYPYKRFFYVPSLFWLNASNTALMGAVLLGTFLSLILMWGAYPSLCLALLFMLYLSIIAVGQEFLSFGWESFLLEITFYTFWMSLTPIPNVMMWICLNFLLFRFHVQAGAVKLQSHDRTWRNLTALAFHYQTQPLPNTEAWYVAKWPLSFHKLSTLFMFAVELFVPFGLFLGEYVRAGTGIILIGLQVLIWLTGNLSYLNHLTAVFCIIAFSNVYLTFIMTPIQADSSNGLLEGFLTVLGTLLLILQMIRLWHHFRPEQRLAKCLRCFAPFHLINPFGLFAIMTTKRYEIVVEGSMDGKHWQEYLCKYKPSDITRRPGRISPYQPRLDWQMWFLPFDHFASQSWFHQFLYHLLKGTPIVLQLLRYNPFPNQPPKYVRALIYDYQFSTYQQKKEKGWWWQRSLVSAYSPVMTLKESEEEDLF